MKEVLSIYVRGEPKPQPRPRARAIRSGGKWIGTVYDPGTADLWKSRIRAKVEEAWTIFAPDARNGHGRPKGFKPLVLGPVDVGIDFYFPRPQYMLDDLFKYGRAPIPCKNHQLGDGDNLTKAVWDAITDTEIFWKDDSDIVRWYGGKWYCGINADGTQAAPGARIVVSLLGAEEGVLFNQEEPPPRVSVTRITQPALPAGKSEAA